MTAPLGYIPSPYGVPVAVHRVKGLGDDEFGHDLDGCMTIAGIHRKANRDRCKAALEKAMGKGGVPFQIFLDHGGCKVPHIPIQRPDHPAYTNMPKTHGIAEPLENWVTLALDHSSWADRAAAFLPVLDYAMESTKSWKAPPEIAAAGLADDDKLGVWEGSTHKDALYEARKWGLPIVDAIVNGWSGDAA